MIALLLNSRVWLALALAGLMAWGAHFFYGAGEAHTQAAFDAYKLAAEESRVLADRATALENERKQSVVNKEIDRARQETAQARADTAAAGAARDQLHGQLATYVAAVHRLADAASAARSTSVPSATAVDLLAKLYSGSDGAEGDIATFADRLDRAGGTCERISDGLQPQASGGKIARQGSDSKGASASAP
jgi:Protein of unknown function (DUF2514)